MGLRQRLSEIFGVGNHNGVDGRQATADRRRIRAARGRYQSMFDSRL